MANDDSPSGPVFSSDDQDNRPKNRSRRGWIFGLIGTGLAAIIGAFAWTKYATVNTDSYINYVPGKDSSGVKVAVGKVDQFSKAAAPVAVTINGRPAFVDFHKSRTVLSAICPHNGCPVNWDSSKGQYVCPCHGSAFAEDGAVVKGPSTQSLHPYQVDVEDGTVYALA